MQASYAPTGRAKCAEPRCGKNIAKASVRIGRQTTFKPTDGAAGDPITSTKWYHVPCFHAVAKRARTWRLTSSAQLAGFQNLTEADRAAVATALCITTHEPILFSTVLDMVASTTEAAAGLELDNDDEHADALLPATVATAKFVRDNIHAMEDLVALYEFLLGFQSPAGDDKWVTELHPSAIPALCGVQDTVAATADPLSCASLLTTCIAARAAKRAAQPGAAVQPVTAAEVLRSLHGMTDAATWDDIAQAAAAVMPRLTDVEAAWFLGACVGLPRTPGQQATLTRIAMNALSPTAWESWLRMPATVDLCHFLKLHAEWLS